MLKNIFFIVLFLFFSVRSNSQNTPKTGTIEYNKTTIPCYKMEVPHPNDITEEAIRKKFKEMGVSGKEHNGFLQFKNVKIKEVSNKPVDAYVKVERKSKKEKDITNLSLFFTEPGIEPGTPDSKENALDATVASVGAFGLLSAISDHSGSLSLDQEIKIKREAVKEAENESNKLQKEGNNLQDKFNKLQSDIEENRKNQTKLAEEITKRKEALAASETLKKETLSNSKKNN